MPSCQGQVVKAWPQSWRQYLRSDQDSLNRIMPHPVQMQIHDSAIAGITCRGMADQARYRERGRDQRFHAGWQSPEPPHPNSAVPSQSSRANPTGRSFRESRAYPQVAPRPLQRCELEGAQQVGPCVKLSQKHLVRRRGAQHAGPCQTQSEASCWQLAT